MGAPALAQTPVAAPTADLGPAVIVNDPARLQVTESIMTNLGLYEIMVHVGQKELLDSPAAANYTPTQKAQLAQYFAAAMAPRRTQLIHKLAASVRGDFSLDQLNSLQALSRVKYVQDLVAQGADPNMVADASSLTVADQNLVQSVGNQPFVSDFFTKAINYNVLKDDVVAATLEAYKAFNKGN
jgi:hypothetical protein